MDGAACGSGCASGGSSSSWEAEQKATMTDRIHAEVKSMIASSRLVRHSDGLALVRRDELEVGSLLGRGAFSEVHEVRLRPSCDNSSSMSSVSFDCTNRRHCFAMKHLKSKLLTQPDNFRLAAAELAVEAHMLASFNHPNILKIRGWAANGVASFSTGRHDSFFLLLDKLEETLDQRIDRWRQQKLNKENCSPEAPLPPPPPPTAMGGGGNIVSDLWRRFGGSTTSSAEASIDPVLLKKIGVCVEIASALSYLHSVGVIFRDLKPNNIGFLDGRVQLFDFGLSRELPKLNLDEPFEMSGKVGTLRYMSPEVASHQVYNVSADVYSWAMVCFEIFVLEKPFQGWTRDMHANLVCGRGARPEATLLPAVVRPILESCWSQYPYRRPAMCIAKEQMRHIEQQHLLIACRQRHASGPGKEVSVELPFDFSLSVRKVANRHPSETFTSATAVSTESLSDFVFQH